MPRLFHRGEWFVEISPTALSESEFEALLIQNAKLLHPDATMVPYKKTAYAEDRSARGDLAIIANDYREWLVVEVEMERHDLHRHVIPQILTLRSAVYDQEHADYLAGKNPTLDQQKLSDMLRGESPHVLVIVNKFDAEWSREIRRYGAHMVVFEIFRSETTNRHIFAIDGSLPLSAEEIVSELTFSLIPRCLTVRSPAALDFRRGERVSILVEGQVTFWERFDTATECYLSPVGGLPLKRGQRYALLRTDSGEHAIQPMPEKGRSR
jgi:hypothetical protein